VSKAATCRPLQGDYFGTLTSGIGRQAPLDPFLSLATGIFRLTKSALYSINWRKLAELPCVTIAIDGIGKSRCQHNNAVQHVKSISLTI
jgi:hypothetical protein